MRTLCSTVEFEDVIPDKLAACLIERTKCDAHTTRVLDGHWTLADLMIVRLGVQAEIHGLKAISGSAVTIAALVEVEHCLATMQERAREALEEGGRDIFQPL